ncbi:MAG: type II toxin-antitoxin system HicA family toxin [candidate division SR1 bacterium]|nr:type II toxin-antitoxin system HicA family toxin [candidate division SR1 bacterium]
MKQYKPEEIKRFLLKRGREETHQKGSHCYLYNPETKKITTIPMHTKDLKIGTLMAILRQTGFTKEDLE